MNSREKILIFSGTTEGKIISHNLAERGFEVTMCVATEYGEKVVPENKNVDVRVGRLDENQIQALIQSEGFKRVIDATHPYAEIVSENIKCACDKCNCEYMRALRKSSDYSDVIEVASVTQAVEFLNKTQGNVLLTTGSKELEQFTAVENYKDRLYARVLSTADVTAKCAQIGFEGKNLFAMQGPFCLEMNVAMLKQIDAKYLVTKDSGSSGGFEEKLSAAKKTGAKVILIKRPSVETGYSVSQLLEKLTGRAVDKTVYLVGIGMGNPDNMTIEAAHAFEDAELIIGAGRMLDTVAKFGKKMVNEYKSDAIVNTIVEADVNSVAVALSGDIGFYSGAKLLRDKLIKYSNITVKNICGISSVVYMCAKLAMSWQDMHVMSMHGRRENLVAAVKENEKTFTIAGSGTAVNELLESLCISGLGDVYVYAGGELSYDNETIIQGKAQELLHESFPGLCSLVIINEKAKDFVITHGISDSEFIRGDVPMTKEEVRSVSISKLRLTKNSVVYDIGAGTGSVSIEAARMVSQGKVYAIERKDEACELIERNCRKFGCENVEIIKNYAPEGLEGLEAPTHVFIGGSGGNMKQIVQEVFKKNSRARVVINTIAMESTAEALDIINTLNVADAEIVSLNVARSRKIARYNMMTGNNPVFVFSFTGRGE